MPYSDVSGLNTVFPTAPTRSAPRASAPAKRARATASRSRPTRTPRAKPACKYGPRDADGYCPKKPKAAPREDAGILSAPAPRKRKRQSIGQKLERTTTTAVVRAGQKAAVKGVGKIQAAGGLKAVLKSPIATGVGTGAVTVGGAIALAAAAGIAAFLGTTAILNAIKNKKEREQQAAFEAAQAFRNTRLSLEKGLKRALTIPELQALHSQFTVGLKNRGW